MLCIVVLDSVDWSEDTEPRDESLGGGAALLFDDPEADDIRGGMAESVVDCPLLPRSFVEPESP